MRDVILNEPTLPARHPADRDRDQSSSSSSNPSSSVGTTATAATTTNGESQPKKTRSWTLGGVHISSFIRLVFLLGLMAGTAAAWWYTVKHFRDSMATNQSRATDQGQGNAQVTNGWSSTVFVHVAFSVVALFEFIFLERIVFHIRAERYMFIHGMSLDARRAATLGIAPWNRPPLPTYAAALAESGHGTGDVEDNLSMYPFRQPRHSAFCSWILQIDPLFRCSCDRAPSRVRKHPRQRPLALVDAPRQPHAHPQPCVAEESAKHARARRRRRRPGGRDGGGQAEPATQLRRIRGGR